MSAYVCPQHGTTPNALCHVQQASPPLHRRITPRPSPNGMDRIAGLAFMVGLAIPVAIVTVALLAIWLVQR